MKTGKANAKWDWWVEHLERDEVDEEFGIGVEGLGIGGDISP
jgi:hypothetical protein